MNNPWPERAFEVWGIGQRIEEKDDEYIIRLLQGLYERLDRIEASIANPRTNSRLSDEVPTTIPKIPPSFDEMMRTIPIHPFSREGFDLMDRYKTHYQRFYKCSDEEANDAEESVRLLLGDGCSLMQAWTAVYEKGDFEKTRNER